MTHSSTLHNDEQSLGVGYPEDMWWAEQDFSLPTLSVGDVVEGVIAYVGPDEILIDIGAKTEAIVSPREVQRMSPEELRALKVGDTIRACVLTPESRQGEIVVSLEQAKMEDDWDAVQQLFSDGKVFEVEVAGHNKGGLIIQHGHARAFLPASQLNRQRRLRSPDGVSLADVVGEKIWVKIIELDRERNRLILSERAAMRQINKISRERLFSELKEGDTVTGEVISLADFGAFVSLGGADGLVHLSELAWHRVEHPGEVLQVGDEVEVYVINVDRERQKIGLSLKRLQPEPWTVVDERYGVGQVVEATITRLAKFGAFARLDDVFEGLIHISELAHRPINQPKEVVSEGDRVNVKIIRIEKERRRIGLSLKQVVEGETPHVIIERLDELDDGLGESSVEG